MSAFISAAYKSALASQFLAAPPILYSFIGQHMPNPNDAVPGIITDSSQLQIDTFNNMIGGVKVKPSDLSLMVQKNEWTSGIIYNCYSSTIQQLIHITVQQNGYYHFYKCIDNNNNSSSTYPPMSLSLYCFQTADSYTWKYLGSVDVATYLRFSTNVFVPFVANTSVQAAAVPSTVDAIRIISGGRGYNNYISGVFRSQDITHGTVSFGLIDTANAVSGFYTSAIIKITTPGSAILNQYRTITDYQTSNNTKLITINAPFSQLPSVGDTYDINPAVIISSTNSSANVAIGRCFVNAATGNTIQSIEVLARGSNHINTTAVVAANTVVGVQQSAAVQSVVSPLLGHGADGFSELQGDAVGIVSNLNSLPVIADNDFRQYGLLRNPVFKSVSVKLQTGPGTKFTVGETISFYGSANTSIGTGTCAATNATHITLSNCLPVLADAVRLVGTQTDAVAQSNSSNSTVTVANRLTNCFDVFVQELQFIGTSVGSFVNDETVRLGGGTGKVHTSNSTALFVSSISNAGIITTVTGTSSNAVFTPTQTFGSDLQFGSGQIMFNATILPVTRSLNSTDITKIVLEFGK